MAEGAPATLAQLKAELLPLLAELQFIRDRVEHLALMRAGIESLRSAAREHRTAVEARLEALERLTWDAGAQRVMTEREIDGQLAELNERLKALEAFAVDEQRRHQQEVSATQNYGHMAGT